jgi:hypothetical protein
MRGTLLRSALLLHAICCAGATPPFAFVCDTWPRPPDGQFDPDRL